MDYNNKISKEEFVGKYVLSGEKGASKTEVEIMEYIAMMHNKAYEGGYRAGKKEAEEKAVAQIPQSEPVAVNDGNVLNISGVSCYEKDGVAYLRLEDVSRGLGFVETHNGKEYVRWQTVEKYLRIIGFSQKVEKDGYVPENVFYRLAMKANNAVAEKFQALVADEIIPSIRKHGMYATPKTLAEMLRNPESVVVMLTAIQEEQQKNRQLEQENAKLKPASDYAHAVLMSKESLTTKQIAQNYGMSARQLNSLLNKMKIQYKVNKQWILYSKYQGKGYVVGVPFEVGEGNTVENTRWTRKGQAFLYKKLKEAGYLPVNEQLQMVAE